MKTLVEYINESKYFTLTPSERDALVITVGNITGALGDEEDMEEYAELKKDLSEEELKKLDELFEYVLDNEQDYPKINRNIIKDEIPILVKILTWMDENGIGSYEHTDMLEKMTTK